MNALDKAYKELTQSKKQKQEIRLESNPVVIMHEFKNEVMRFLKQLASIALTHDYRTSITNFPKVQQVEVSKLPKEAFKVVNEIDTTKIEKMISEMKEMSKRDKQVLVKNQVDMSMVETLLESVVRAVEASKKTNDGSTTKDSKELLRAITELKDVMSKDKQMAVTIANFDSFPVALPIASYKNSAGETKQGLVDADNHVQVDVLTAPAVTIDTTGLATDTNQTNGSQKTQIVDAGGEAATVTGGKLDVNASIDTTGLATSANQTTIIGHLDGVEGLLTTIDADTGTIATEVAGLLTDTELRATPVPVSGTVAVTNSGITTIAGAVSGTEMQVDVLTMPTTAVTGTFWQATQPVSLTSTTVTGTVAVTQSGTWTVTADTELPTAAALSDSTSNPTTPIVGAALMGWDGAFFGRVLNAQANVENVAASDKGIVSNARNYIFDGSAWDRTPGNSTDGTLVNLGSNNDVTVTGTVAVTQSGTWDEVGINDSGNSITVDYATTGSGTATGALRVELPTNGTGVIATVGAVTAITNALPAGTNAIGKLAANSGVDIGDTDVTSVVPGTGATNLGKAEDGAHTSGDVGVMDLGVRNDTMADFTGADNDYTPKSVTLKGQTLTTNAPRGRKLHQITTITSSTSETTVLTAAASTYHDVYGIIVTNTSATATEVSFKDATAGTTRFTISAPANDTRGFMVPVDAAVVQSATNNNWTATCADSVASIIITVLAVKNL